MKIICLIAFLLFFSTFNVSMAQIAGCTDTEANNYNASATINNGSCKYNAASVLPSASFNLAGQLIETSGLICWNNQVWTHNDSDDTNLYALDSANGNIIQTYRLNNVKNTDWEEISQDADFVYVGDFGNNNGNRSDLHILRITKESILLNKPVIETINFSYSNQANFAPAGTNNTDFDCEAFIVSNDSIYLFTKQWISNKTSLYSMPKTPGTYIAHLKSTLDVEGLITGATYLESKKLIVLCGYSKDLEPFVYLLYGYKDNDFLSGNKRKINVSLPLHQVEGIATTNGLKYYISNEYFSEPPFIDTPQQLHIIDLSDYLGSYINYIYNSVSTQPVVNDILFPNPATEFLNFKTGKIQSQTAYRISNQSGQVVLSGKLTPQQQGVNISGLPAGIYIVTIDADKIQSFKLIKN